MTTFTPAPKPERAPPQKQLFRNSTIKSKDFGARVEAAKRLRKPAKKAKANNVRAYGDHAEYIRSLPCCVCGFQGVKSDAAHTTTGGTSRKADAKTLVPLCKPHWVTSPSGQSRMVEGCHRESHRGIQSFEKRYRVDLKAVAAGLWEERE